MTVATASTNRVQEAGNGSKTAFDFGFRIFSASEILVYKVVTATSAQTLQTLSTDYTVAINGIDNALTTPGGTVTYVVAPTALEQSLIISDYSIDQQTDIPVASNFPEVAVEDALDKLTLIAIQLNEIIGRAAKVPSSVSLSGLELPIPAASELLRWNALANGLENVSLIGLGTITDPVPVANGGTGGTTGAYELAQGADRAIGVAENTSGAGDDFTLSAGDALSSGTDIDGGSAKIQGGASQGTGVSLIDFLVAKAGSSGSSTNAVQLILRLLAEALVVNPHGTSSGNTGELRFLELAANGTNYTGFKSPDSLSANLLYILPTTAPTAGQILSSDASNVLSWIDAGGGGGNKEITWLPGSFESNNANPASLQFLNGTNVDTMVRAFDDTTQEYVEGKFVVPSEIDTSGTVTFRVYVMAATADATNRNIEFTFEHLALNGSEDFDPSSPYTSEVSGDIDTGTTQDNVIEFTWTETVSNLAWAANDLVIFRLSRTDPSATELSGDAYLFSFTVQIPRA